MSTSGKQAMATRGCCRWQKNDGQMKPWMYYNYKLVHQNRLIQFLPFADGILTEAEAERCVLGYNIWKTTASPKGTFLSIQSRPFDIPYSDETGPVGYFIQTICRQKFQNPYETAIDLKQPFLTVNGNPACG